LRSEATRQALLVAAEIVFARDGFEAARLEDIAAEAGRSRGAFYANFESKTELFLALRQRMSRHRAVRLRELIEATAEGPERNAALVQHLIQDLQARQPLLLEIEFKLFAIRHPELRAELAERHLEASSMVKREEFADLFLPDDGAAARERRNILAVESLLEGFTLNDLLLPGTVDEETLRVTFTALVERMTAQQ
jgi:AcrR family transcriptional regulator